MRLLQGAGYRPPGGFSDEDGRVSSLRERFRDQGNSPEAVETSALRATIKGARASYGIAGTSWPSRFMWATSTRGSRGRRGTPSHSHRANAPIPAPQNPEKPPPPPPPLSPPLSLAPRCDVSPNTLLPPKHGLPSKPPAEVCVPISGNTQPCAPLSSPSQPGEMSRPPPSSENPRHGVASLCDLAHHIRNSHPTPACDVQDSISDTPTEPPPLGRGATGADSSSPNITSSDGSLEDFCRLPDLQNNIPIDPAILADDAPWDIGDLHLPIHPARCGTVVNVPCYYSTSDDFLSDEQSTGRKRGRQQPEEPVAKRLRVAYASSMEGSSTALRSHFLSLQLDDRLQCSGELHARLSAGNKGGRRECAASRPLGSSQGWRKSAWARRGDKGPQRQAVVMAPRGLRTAPEHDGGAPTLAGDREVFSGKDGIGAAPAGVYASETREGNAYSRICNPGVPAASASPGGLLIFLLLGGDPSSAQVYITGEGMPPAHRTAMRSPLLLYSIRSHGRMIPTLLSLLLAAAPCFNGWREHPGTSTPVTIPISWYTQRAPSASRSIVLLTLKHDPSVPKSGVSNWSSIPHQRPSPPSL
ncbi:uncharacterized protein PADG_07408 [Paracoccidioides brasiliensis Pb18]|uniref:Uncharacterized protein n=1 Tax=Paracoccidioides brasiliensis (strain Pb18) TaxID=502780 RepID=C1GJH2_PARBD|nr:uncharacterized protein PADG_07408 [Paracoccidioides brasiliensis Pb18]EEH42588.2 hypothetical protein PADG_07408 [Paracoccidioides brasiliensis Pb18]